MNHQPLSASFVLGWAGLNSAELSRSGRAVISIQLAWLTGLAEQVVLCTGVRVRPLAVQYSGLDLRQVCPATAARQVVWEVTVVVVAEEDSCPQPHHSAPEPPLQLRKGKLFPAY